MVCLPVSAKKPSPPLSVAAPAGLLKCAALPIPSSDPEPPAGPAKVVKVRGWAWMVSAVTARKEHPLSTGRTSRPRLRMSYSFLGEPGCARLYTLRDKPGSCDVSFSIRRTTPTEGRCHEKGQSLGSIAVESKPPMASRGDRVHRTRPAADVHHLRRTGQRRVGGWNRRRGPLQRSPWSGDRQRRQRLRRRYAQPHDPEDQLR